MKFVVKIDDTIFVTEALSKDEIIEEFHNAWEAGKAAVTCMCSFNFKCYGIKWNLGQFEGEYRFCDGRNPDGSLINPRVTRGFSIQGPKDDAVRYIVPLDEWVQERLKQKNTDWVLHPHQHSHS